MSEIVVALLQICANGTDQASNLSKGVQFCRQAAQLGADIALYPEMWNIGYTPFDLKEPNSLKEWQNRAIDRDSDFVMIHQELAIELNMAIALTYLEKWPGSPRNVVSLIDRHGAIQFTYAKVHTCDFDPMEAALTPGEDFYVTSLDTTKGDVKIGALICYDREFPESARILMLKGAELILTPNACELEINRLSQYRSRAFENMVALAMANYPIPQCNGHSLAFDGIAFDDNGSRDMLVVEAGQTEGVYLAKLDLNALREYRQKETWGNAFRKPDSYHILISGDTREPFIRTEARR
ncbi:MAG: carbon-nitrogen hydrolase family protein [Anaerolineales bacterium]